VISRESFGSLRSGTGKKQIAVRFSPSQLRGIPAVRIENRPCSARGGFSRSRVGVHAGSVGGVALCRMFNRAIRGQRWMSKYLSSDNDPLYRFHQWQANLRVLELTEIKSIPCVPLSHPFVERLIGTLRREYLDHLWFWTTSDRETKLLDFRTTASHQPLQNLE
jgi:hypothetical protein